MRCAYCKARAITGMTWDCIPSCAEHGDLAWSDGRTVGVLSFAGAIAIERPEVRAWYDLVTSLANQQRTRDQRVVGRARKGRQPMGGGWVLFS